MILSDCSHAFPEESKNLEDRLLHLYQLQAHAKNDREWSLLNYMVRRAWRPMHKILRNKYMEIWPNAECFHYFFPEHTFNAIAWRARDRMLQPA